LSLGTVGERSRSGARFQPDLSRDAMQSAAMTFAVDGTYRSLAQLV